MASFDVAWAKEQIRRLSEDEAASTYVGVAVLAVLVLLGFVALMLLRLVLRFLRYFWGCLRSLVYPLGEVPHARVYNYENSSDEDVDSGRERQARNTHHKGGKNAKGKGKGKQPHVQKKEAERERRAHTLPTKAPVAPKVIPPMRDERLRQDTPSNQFDLVKGFRMPISVAAVAPENTTDLVFLGTDDRQYKLFKASTLGHGNENVPAKIDKATIPHASFDATGTSLAVFVDNERKVRVYSVAYSASAAVTMSWEAKIPPVAVAGIGCGPGGGYAVVLEEGGGVFVVNRLGKEVDRTTIKLGTVRQWKFSANGTLLGVCGSMSNSVRVMALIAGSRSTTDNGPLWKGVTADAYDHSSRRWYPAVVDDVDGPETYSITWREGGVQTFHVPRKDLRPTGVQMRGEDYSAMRHAMTLTGHKLGLTAVGFSADGARAVSCSEDGGVRVWDTSVRWNMNEDARLLSAFNDSDYCHFTHVAISPNNKIVVLGTPSTSLMLYRIDTKEPTIIGEITESHRGGGILTHMAFVSKSVLMTVAEGDSKVCLTLVFHSSCPHDSSSPNLYTRQAKLWNLNSKPPCFKLEMK